MTNLTTAKAFIATVLPAPSKGEFLNIHRIVTFRDGTRGWTKGEAFISVDSALSFVSRLPERNDIYVCMSSQSKAGGKIGDHYKASRRKANAVRMKAIWLDIDVKPDAYPDIEAALRGLDTFVAAVGLPAPSAIIGSGGGLHVYWAFARPVAVDGWKQLAVALVNAARTNGLLFDSACTIDAVRVLRLPDTFNAKEQPLRRVAKLRGDWTTYSLPTLAKSLSKYASGKVAAENGSFGKLSSRFNNTPVQSHMTSKFSDEKLGALAILKQCPLLRNALKTGGKRLDNPLWNLTTLAAAFCKEGRKLAHGMANKHPTYNKADTDNLFDRKLQEIGEGVGWPSCNAFKFSGGKECQTCPHFSGTKSPLRVAFGQPAADIAPPPATTLVEFDDLPERYVRKRGGRVYQAAGQFMIKGEPIEHDILLTSHAMVKPWLDDAAKTLNFLTDDPVHNRYTQVTISWGALSNNQALGKELNANGVFVAGAELPKVSTFMASWASKLKSIAGAVRTGDAVLGWYEKGGKLGFSFAGSVWMADGTSMPARLADHNTANFYTPAGDLSVWRKASEMITTQRRPALDAILASAFAAPLVRFTGERGLVMSAYSTGSGVGKTTTLKVAQAVWGDPVRGMQGLGDTANAALHRFSIMRSLPLYWDELKSEDDSKRFSTDIVFPFTSGKGKARLSATAEAKDIGSWQTMMVSASNESVADVMIGEVRSTQAGLYRIFEFTVPPGTKGRIDGIEAARMVSELDNNFGHAGLAYAKWLVANVDLAKREISRVGKAMKTAFDTTSEERFWVALCATLICGARFAKQLGLADIDTGALTEFLAKRFKEMRQRIGGGEVLNDTAGSVAFILNAFLREKAIRFTLRTETVWVDKGRPIVLPVLIGSRDRLDTVEVHAGQNGFIRISKGAFIKWLQRNRHVPGNVIAALVKYGVKDRQGSLGAGTPYATGTEKVLDIDPATTSQQLLSYLAVTTGDEDDGE